MSRASDLRDAVVAELDAVFSVPVDTVVFPGYEREELVSGHRIFVRRGIRTVEVDMGPHRRLVAIELGVVGLLNPSVGENPTQEEYRAQGVAQSDVFDDTVEQMIALWSPKGPLLNKGLAGHSFDSINETQTQDIAKLYETGVFLAVLTLTFADSIDD